MPATTEANSLGSFFALGKQAAKGTAATALFKALATTSGLGARFDTRDPRLEHPAASTRATRRKAPTKRTSYLAEVPDVSFALYPKFFPVALMAVGFQISSTNNTTHYTHVCTLGAPSAHKWMTAAWNVDESDAAFVTRGVDMRGTSLALAASPDEIIATLSMLGLKLEPMSGSPTYTSEATYEIVPWNWTRTTLTIGGYTISERIRTANFNIENTLREDDRAIGETTRANLGQQTIEISSEFADINISDDLYEAIFYGGSGGSTVDLDAVTGAIDMKWTSDDNISGAAVPYSVQIALPSVEWELSTAPQASGDDLVTMGLTAYMVDNVTTPVTITVVNDVSSY